MAWQFQFLDFAKGENRSDWFLTLNPSGKMPVLKDGEFVLTESAAIMQYLAEVYGPNWLPARGTQASALHAQWVSFITCELEQPLWTIGKHRFALPEAQRLPAIFPTAKWEFDKAAAIAESWVPEQGYLLGEQVTIADLLLAHTLMWATRFEQTIPQAGGLSGSSGQTPRSAGGAGQDPGHRRCRPGWLTQECHRCKREPVWLPFFMAVRRHWRGKALNWYESRSPWAVAPLHTPSGSPRRCAARAPANPASFARSAPARR